MSGRELGKAICEALGVDPSRAIKVVLTIEVDAQPTLDITEVVVTDGEIDGDEVVELMSHYRLVER